MKNDCFDEVFKKVLIGGFLLQILTRFKKILFYLVVLLNNIHLSMLRILFVLL